MNDYIFCPFCGGITWITDKSGYAKNGRLESHKCESCKKFTYVNHFEKTTSPGGLEHFRKSRFSIDARIDPYQVTVFYHKDSTQFRDIHSGYVILVLKQAVAFNWYKNEELVDKIKKYVVFS